MSWREISPLVLPTWYVKTQFHANRTDTYLLQQGLRMVLRAVLEGSGRWKRDRIGLGEHFYQFWVSRLYPVDYFFVPATTELSKVGRPQHATIAKKRDSYFIRTLARNCLKMSSWRISYINSIRLKVGNWMKKYRKYWKCSNFWVLHAKFTFRFIQHFTALSKTSAITLWDI